MADLLDNLAIRRTDEERLLERCEYLLKRMSRGDALVFADVLTSLYERPEPLIGEFDLDRLWDVRNLFERVCAVLGSNLASALKDPNGLISSLELQVRTHEPMECEKCAALDAELAASIEEGVALRAQLADERKLKYEAQVERDLKDVELRSVQASFQRAANQRDIYHRRIYSLAAKIGLPESTGVDQIFDAIDLVAQERDLALTRVKELDAERINAAARPAVEPLNPDEDETAERETRLPERSSIPESLETKSTRNSDNGVPASQVPAPEKPPKIKGLGGIDPKRQLPDPTPEQVDRYLELAAQGMRGHALMRELKVNGALLGRIRQEALKRKPAEEMERAKAAEEEPVRPLSLEQAVASLVEKNTPELSRWEMSPQQFVQIVLGPESVHHVTDICPLARGHEVAVLECRIPFADLLGGLKRPDERQEFKALLLKALQGGGKRG